MNRAEFTVSGKGVEVYPAAASDRPVIYLNTFAEEAGSVHKELCNMNCPDFTLVAISGLDWNHDMSPWSIPPIAKDDTPCTGGANDYLELLTGAILPEAEASVKGNAAWRGLAGYSLAGLFAVYSMYQTEFFTRIASMSGSLWFPEFKEYVFSHELMKKPDYLYFSLGDRESRTSNPYLKPVQDNTEEIEAFYNDQEIETVFQLNPGNHYQDAARRTAAGIDWILSK